MTALLISCEWNTGSNRHQGDFRTGLTEETRFSSFWLKDVYARSVIENTRVFCPESEFLELRNMIDSGLEPTNSGIQ